MSEQNFRNHKRYYAPHHLIFYPIIIVLIVFSGIQAKNDEANRLLWIMLAVAFGMIGWFSFMVRQHYAMTLQDRLILLELRHRYFVLTGERLEDMESNLRKSQLFALRFAPDSELKELIDRALKENLSSTDIKRSVKNWKADNNRV